MLAIIESINGILREIKKHLRKQCVTWDFQDTVSQIFGLSLFMKIKIQ